MKIRVLVLTVIAACLTLSAGSNDNFTQMSRGSISGDRWHVLGSLWREYEKASSADKPATQLEILSRIKYEASDQRLAWDFYDAGVKYVEVGTVLNWKERSTLMAEWKKEVATFDEPIVSLECCSTALEIKDLITADKDRLASARNEAFYHETGRLASQMGGELADYVSNDYEYALWALFLRQHSLGHDELETIVEGSYPNGAWLEYLDAGETASDEDPEDDRYASRKAALAAVAGKYEGRGLALYPLQDLLVMRKDSLDKAGAGADAYFELLRECEAFLKLKSALGGSEAAIGSGVVKGEALAASLQVQSLGLEADTDSIRVIFHNLGSATLFILQDEDEVWREEVTNPKRSFYIPDSLSIVLPSLDDGSYVLRADSDEISTEIPFHKYTLSMAVRLNADGRGIYITDYKSGEPLDSATITLLKGDETLSEKIALGEGFTPLPSRIASAISGKTGCRIQTSLVEKSIVRSSDELDIHPGVVLHKTADGGKSERCRIFMDRGAYNPGDSVYIKAVLYGEASDGNLSVLAPGEVVQLGLYDSEKNEIQTLRLLTDDFGSVAARLRIPTGLRNGKFHIKVSCGGNVGTKYFTVDDFSLPTFCLTFNPVDKFYLPGDTVPLSGNIFSYSGHPLSSARISYKILSGGKMIEEGVLVPDGEGNFSIGIASDPSKSSQSFNVTVTVTDGTGETREYTKFVDISSSVSLSLSLDNEAEGVAVPGNGLTGNAHILAESLGSFTATVRNRSGQVIPAELGWTLLTVSNKTLTNESDRKDTAVLAGTVRSGENFHLDFSGLSSGLYRMEAEVSLRVAGHDNPVEAAKGINILLIRPSDTTLGPYVDHLVLPTDEYAETGSYVGLRLGTSTGPLWAVAELYGENSELLGSRLVHLDGGGDSQIYPARSMDAAQAEGSSIADVLFEYKAGYPDAVRLQLFYFRDGSSVSYNRQFRRVIHNLDLPLEFSRFEDKTSPDSSYSFGIKTAPGVQCLAAVFDKSSEEIVPNIWTEVTASQPGVPSVSVSDVCGHVGSLNEIQPILLATRSAAVTSSSECIPARATTDESSVTIRSDFASTLCFEPFLLSDKEGCISLDFKTSDKLSTYWVSLFAHDTSMRNAVLRRETVVTIPVKVEVSQPAYLYSGDEYLLSATVSSSLGEALSGTLTFSQYDGVDRMTSPLVCSQSETVTIPAGGSETFEFSASVPIVAGDEARDMGIMLVFKAEGYSDGLFVSVPVLPAVQHLGESHSSVLLADSYREALLQELRDLFVNVSPDDAECSETSILDMVMAAIPTKVEPASDNVLDLTEAYYVRLLSKHLASHTKKVPLPLPSDTLQVDSKESDDELLSRVLACQEEDGGFAWFEGMGSSPIITAVVLEHLAKLGASDLCPPMPDDVIPAAVKYLDDNYFTAELPTWRGGLSLSQYLYARALWPSVEFNPSVPGDTKISRQKLAEFRESVCNLLIPSGKHGLAGDNFVKTCCLATLRSLSSSPDGLTLAKAWGVKSSRKIAKSIRDDVASLLEYAIEHRYGGCYYPGLVGRRGLLEDEAYAHSILSDQLAGYASTEATANAEIATKAASVADGIRLWLMLQKETQNWGSAPAFVDAIRSILAASDKVLTTKVISLSKTYERPFSEILPSGNGLSISREFYRQTIDQDGKVVTEAIAEGTPLERGDKITVRYTVRNEENRSFVHLHAPREAALTPVDQLSGSCGWSNRAAKSDSYSYTPRGYREVKSASTEYYFDVYPEEGTTISEDFFVTQNGLFSAPVVSIECLYSPSYAANAPFRTPLRVR